MITPAKLPRTVDELTPKWLEEVIRLRFPDVTVTSFTIDKVIWGTATKVLIDVQFAGNAKSHGLPNKLCVKGDFDERSRQTFAGRTTSGTQIEAQFFNELAPLLGVPLPRHWYGGSEPGMGILILDNLAAANATFGAPTKPWSPDLVSKALEVLAVLHASTWEKKFPEISWLRIGSPPVRQATEALMSEQHWQGHFVKSEVFKMPAALSDRERGLKGFRAMWHYDDANAHCIIHGDAHLGNTCIDASGQPFFMDWAGPCYSYWAFDVANFIVGAMTVADRRATETDLVHHYLDWFANLGGPRLDGSEAFDDYRRHIMHGMLWMTLPSTLQSVENGHAMGERYASALIEHDTLHLLGV